MNTILSIVHIKNLKLYASSFKHLEVKAFLRNNFSMIFHETFDENILKRNSHFEINFFVHVLFLCFHNFCLEKYEISEHLIVKTLLSIVHISNSILRLSFHI